MKIRILDRYIFREVVVTFLFGVCAFSAVFLGSGTLFHIAKYITDYGATIQSVVKVLVLSIPDIIVYTFPMSMLLASLLTYGKLSGSSEITAMKSCGISFYRIAVPAIVLGFLVSMFSIWFNEYVVPWANNASNNVVYYEIKGNVAAKDQDHVIIKNIDHGQIKSLVYARRYKSDVQRLENLTLQTFTGDTVTHVENAEYAEWDGGAWIMHNGMIYDIANGDTEHTMRFDTQVLPIGANPKQIVRDQKKPDELTMKELRAQIKIMQSQYVNTTKLETELYQRITIPIASLVFALIGIPLGLQPNRNSSSVGFGISLIIIFVYYVMMTVSGAIAQSGVIDPAYAVWMPNIIGLAAGIVLMRRAAK